MKKISVFVITLLVLALSCPNVTYAVNIIDEESRRENTLNNSQQNEALVAIGVDADGNIIYTENRREDRENEQYYIIDEQTQRDESNGQTSETDSNEIPDNRGESNNNNSADKREESNNNNTTDNRENSNNGNNRESADNSNENRTVAIDLSQYIVNGRFDYSVFEVNEILTNEVPVQKDDTEEANKNTQKDVFFRHEELVEEETTVVESGYAEYYIELEVGRIAHLFPTNAAANVFTVENENIIGKPYEYTEPGFVKNYRAHAKNPGTTTITCTHTKNNVVDFVEVWHVTVYSRDISFEQDNYVVEKTGNKLQYLELKLKNFEYSVDFAYEFKWVSSNPDIAYISGDFMGTECIVSVKSAGVVTLTVSDKYGNSRSTLLVIKPEQVAETVDVKAAVKATKMTAKAKAYKQFVKVSWTADTEVALDGYQVYCSTDGKTFKKLKTVKSGTTYSMKHKKAVSDTVYYYKVRGYKKVDGKNVYTSWSEVKKVTAK